MQHDHVLIKLNFDSNHHHQVRGVSGQKYLQPCYCIPDSVLFDMQHDYVLKTLNFDPTPRVGAEGLWAKYTLIPFIYMQHDNVLK